jgi:hypothetical protein
MTIMSPEFRSALDQIKAMAKPTCRSVLHILEPLLDDRPADDDDAVTDRDWDSDFRELLAETWSLSTCRDRAMMERFAANENDHGSDPVFATPKSVLLFTWDRIRDTGDGPWASYKWDELYP